MTAEFLTNMAQDGAAGPMTPSSPPAPVPLAFGPASRRLFGWYHPPAPGQERDTGVVLCPPIGHEALCTHASYRVLAEQLAAVGFPALRFDYDGTGESIGSDEDADRVQNWLASIGLAIDALRDASGSGGIALFGVRLGATLATVAAAERDDVQELLLWAPCRTGRSYLREMRMLRAGHAGPDPPPQPASAHGVPAPEHEPAYEEAAGFVVTRATADALDQLDVSSLAGPPAARS